jgi:histidine ammonia-lyase
MTPPDSVQLDGGSLDLPAIEAVARRSRRVQLAGTAHDGLAASAEQVRSLAAGDRPVYGVNTGYGIFADRRIPNADIPMLARNLIRSHAVGVGPPFAPAVTRAAILIRANTLSLGLSGVRPAVVEALIALLNRDATPAIPSQGSLGSSGDLAPLAHLALALCEPDAVPDIPEAWFPAGRRAWRDGARQLGLEPLTLGPKEGLALTNGATFATALLALACIDLRRTLAAAEAAAALSFEALRGSTAAFDPRLHAARRHPGQESVARRLRALLAGSGWVDSGGHVQDAYSLRCIPQVVGPAWEILEFVEPVVVREANAATDNPLFFDGSAISGGNFHGEPVGVAADYLKIAACEVGAISERRVFRSLSSHTNDGLPPMLVSRPEAAGLESGLMMLQYTAASLVLENQGLASPASVRSLPTSADQEDHNANATTAARTLALVVEHLEHLVAIELLVAAQAHELRRRNLPGVSPGPATSAIQQRVRERVPFLERDDLMAPHIDSLVDLVRSDGWIPETSAG